MPPEPARPAIVQRAHFRPGKCEVTGDIDGPFVDCGIKKEHMGYWNRMYLHVPWVEQIARQLLGMVPRSEIEELKERLKRAEDELEDIQIQAEKINEAERAIKEVIA